MCGFESHPGHKCSVHLGARIQGFHPWHRGSIPLPSTIDCSSRIISSGMADLLLQNNRAGDERQSVLSARCYFGISRVRIVGCVCLVRRPFKPETRVRTPYPRLNPGALKDPLPGMQYTCMGFLPWMSWQTSPMGVFSVV